MLKKTDGLMDPIIEEYGRLSPEQLIESFHYHSVSVETLTQALCVLKELDSQEPPEGTPA